MQFGGNAINHALLGGGGEEPVYPQSLRALMKSPDDLWMNLQPPAPSLPRAVRGTGAQVAHEQESQSRGLWFRWCVRAIKELQTDVSVQVRRSGEATLMERGRTEADLQGEQSADTQPTFTACMMYEKKCTGLHMFLK